MRTAPDWTSANLVLHNRPLRAVHSTLCSRVLINLRKAAARSSNFASSEYDDVEDLEFIRSSEPERPSYAHMAESIVGVVGQHHADNSRIADGHDRVNLSINGFRLARYT